MTAKVTAFAPAKINLTLHVSGRRADGYHLLDSLVAFADIGDEITAAPSTETSLTVSGPMSEGVPTDASNLVMKAARLLDPNKSASLHLTKTLPPASGIGGGSSDAAATLRALSKLWDVPLPAPQETVSLGADLPVCLRPLAQRMSGIGEELTLLPSLPPCDILLVNPGVHVATPSIFKALTSRDNPPMPQELPAWNSVQELAEWLKAQRNDLEQPAITLAPVIAKVLEALAGTEALFSRMSGSGATCFALFPEASPAIEKAAQEINANNPDWWVQTGKLIHLAETTPG
ncbi:MAG: 4-(cytidine 5'-diphospho)-2-C-methyl-D-erythritol kinase [Cognatishimia sp.]|nr:4-(cytidine 5'-diphospho)-2-C-methyl-D-erythritol kinase [Cognatishimia sp.]